MEALERLRHTVTRAYKINPRINFEVFIHKVNSFYALATPMLMYTVISHLKYLCMHNLCV